MAFQAAFLGTPEFAAIALAKLLETGTRVAGVITAPDRPRGRSLKMQPTPVRVLADRAGIPVLTPLDVNAPEVIQAVIAWQANLIVVVAYGQILSESLLDLPPLGSINIHPSLLPRYRGAAPIQRAIMAGETQTGVTICKMTRKLDAGGILLSRPEKILPQDTFGSLHDRLAALGADLMVEAIKGLASGTLRPIPQDDSKATSAPKIKKEEERIVWKKSAAEIGCLVRALNPVPGATATLVCGAGRQIVKMWAVRPVEGTVGKAAPGFIEHAGPDGLQVATGQGWVWIEEIQSASKSRMSIARWLQGHAVAKGDRFDNASYSI